jgi:hypothetical protein
MKRLVQPELLDTLPAADPRAARSRRDLRRVNAWMGNAGIMARALSDGLTGPAPRQVTELGAGDGHFFLRVAQKIKSGQASSQQGFPGRTVVLVDRQENVDPETIAAFARIGWRANAFVSDIFGWAPMSGEYVIANLFLHHFQNGRLVDLFEVISRRAALLVALEPRRARWPLFCSRWLWAMGCNEVTRHDAVVSVHAGFSGSELSSLWPDKTHWHLTEQSAGAFSHLFIARRMD